MGTLELTKSRVLALAAALTFACGSQNSAQPSAGDASGSAALGPLSTPPTPEAKDERQPTSSTLPVDADDGVWGDANAPVTALVFTDLQCPFCARGHASLIELERRYGGSRLRVVIKHVPLAGHEGAVPAARVAQAVLALSGRAAFFRYLDHAFSNQARLAAGEAVALAAELGLSARSVAERAGDAAIGAQVLGDVMLADRIAVPATPHYRINGLGLTGVRSLSELAAVVEAELAAAATLRAEGVPAQDVYARRVQHNFSLPEPQPNPSSG